MKRKMVYLFDKIEEFTEEQLEKAYKLLPPQRQAKAKRYYNLIDRKLCVIAYLLLLKGLREEYGIKTIPEFEYTKNGKPMLRDYPHIYFNMSHCKAGVVCVLWHKPVGIDIQDDTEYNYDVAKRVCSEKELNRIGEAENPAREFCKCWTAKESAVKLSGIGISADLKQLDTSNVQTLCYNSYVISIAEG